MLKADVDDKLDILKSTVSLTQSNRFVLTTHGLAQSTFRKICKEIEEHLGVDLSFREIAREHQSVRYAIQCVAQDLSTKTCLRVIELFSKKSRKHHGSLSFETISR